MTQQSAFSSASPLPSTSEQIQLLEDVEEKQAFSPNQPSLMQAQQQDLTALQSDAAMESFSQEADSFLARLAIIERTPTSAPAPPTLSTTLGSPEDRLPSRQQSRTGGGGSALLPFDMTNVQRELIASQQNVRTTGGRSNAVGVTGEEEESRARRIEIDVDPENREILDQGWEMLKQMRENGEL